jgi:hypothetical protein
MATFKGDVMDTLTSSANNVSAALSDAAPALKQAAVRGQFLGKQGMDTLSEMASNATDSIVSYTKKNPLTALVIAAVSGAILFGLSKAVKASRN